MAFTLGATLAKDSGGNPIAGGLLSADIAGGGTGPTFFFHGLVDGIAGVNRSQIDSSNRLLVHIGAAATAIAKAEDVASADADVGVAIMAARLDTPVANAGVNADGDYTTPILDNFRKLWVTGSYIEDAAAVSDPTGQMLMAVRRDTLSASEVSADGDNIALKATSKGQLHTHIDDAQIPNAGQKTEPNSVPTVQCGFPYETVAASQTNQAMGTTGGAGDYLSHVVVSPGTAGCGVVTILDNATTIVAFPGGGTTPLSNLIPFVIPVGMLSTSGAWKITTGANVTCVAVGRFT